jgi:hypothetical protein
MNSEFENKLQAQISRLKKDKLPERDLWLGIEMGIANQKKRSIPWIGIAASVVICAMGSWIFLSRPADSSSDMARVVDQLDSLHQQEMAALKVAFKSTKPLTNNWNQQLSDMDRAADAIKQALKQDPQNVTLLKMLSDVYQKQIDLLKTVHEPNLQNSEVI